MGPSAFSTGWLHGEHSAAAGQHVAHGSLHHPQATCELLGPGEVAEPSLATPPARIEPFIADAEHVLLRPLRPAREQEGKPRAPEPPLSSEPPPGHRH